MPKLIKTHGQKTGHNAPDNTKLEIMFNLIGHKFVCKHCYILCLWCSWTNRVSMMLKLLSRTNDRSCRIAKNPKVMVSLCNLDVSTNDLFNIRYFSFSSLCWQCGWCNRALIEDDGCHCCCDAANTAQAARVDRPTELT